MLLYSIIMFLTAIPMGAVSLAIYRGKTDLIHDYHQTKVTDPAAYGKAFGKAMFVVAMALFLSGIAGLFGDSETTAKIAAVMIRRAVSPMGRGTHRQIRNTGTMHRRNTVSLLGKFIGFSPYSSIGLPTRS